ncbi:MAG: radical protein [Clostridiaceae bacterium]|jgi:histone acetyltransferase (RNA polymerase elongator complex component)|nr:radical protein [Clostridiaceae bacterium]
MSKSHYIIPIFVPHEGCPHNCVFCNQNSITGSSNDVDGKYVQETMDKYLMNINHNDTIVEVSFYGGTFTAIPIEKQIELLAVAKIYKEKKKVNYIRLSTRPDYIDSAILDNLKKYSVDIIELGVQSLDEEVLLKSGRGHSENDVINASALIKEYGFTLGHQIMIGLPGDTFRKDIETTQKVINMGPSIVRIYPALVIRNTPMEIMYNSSSYKPYSLMDAVKISKILYGLFINSHINVIRIGLQPTEEINEGKEILSGPFHPAFRELVESSIINDMLLEKIGDMKCESITICINPREISKLYAYKKKFFNDMKEQVNAKTVIIQQSEALSEGLYIVKYGSVSKILSKYKYISEKYKEGNFTNI